MRLKAIQRRAAIVAAAVRIANERGLAEATFRTVSDHVIIPTSERLIRYHFTEHEKLWREVANHPEATADVQEQARVLGVA